MSAGGRTSNEDMALLSDATGMSVLRQHRHSVSGHLRKYRELAAHAAGQKLAGLRKVAPELLSVISDEKTLYAAYEHMRTEGSHVPGPDGATYEQFARHEVWNWCRSVRDDIRDGDFSLGAEQVIRIPKGPGRGFRELVVQSIFDRVVQRAVVEVLQPLLDPLMNARSFGFRPGKGPLRALATADLLCKKQKRGVWVSVDIRNAFPSVDVGRMLGVFRKYLPDDELIEFMTALTKPDKRPGLRQGSPLSPLLLNLCLHHMLDRKWRRLHEDVPLLRFADDILILCRTPKQARNAYETLGSLLTPAGFQLKESMGDAIKSLSAGQEVKWMGFGISMSGEGLRHAVTDQAWDALADGFAAAHGKPHSPVAAIHTLCGWLSDKGPCYPHTNMDLAHTRVKRMAMSQGFEEIPDKHTVNAIWKKANEKWQKLRDETTKDCVKARI